MLHLRRRDVFRVGLLPVHELSGGDHFVRRRSGLLRARCIPPTRKRQLRAVSSQLLRTGQQLLLRCVWSKRVESGWVLQVLFDPYRAALEPAVQTTVDAAVQATFVTAYKSTFIFPYNQTYR